MSLGSRVPLSFELVEDDFAEGRQGAHACLGLGGVQQVLASQVLLHEHGFGAHSRFQQFQYLLDCHLTRPSSR